MLIKEASPVRWAPIKSIAKSDLFYHYEKFRRGRISSLIQYKTSS